MPSIDAPKLGGIMSSRVQVVRPVSEAARLMKESRVSCLMVVDRRPLGILTEKDLLGLLDRHDGRNSKVAEVMSAPVITASADDELLESLERFIERLQGH